MYHSRNATRRGNYRASSTSGQRSASAWDQQTQVHFNQLMIALAVFLAVFIGKGSYPQKMLQVRDRILTVISQNTDFRAAFSQLGESLSGSIGELDELESFVVEVFGVDAYASEQTGEGVPTFRPDISAMESAFYQPKEQDSLIAYYLYAQPQIIQAETEQLLEPQTTADEAEKEAVPAAGVVLEYIEYTGQPLPERYTMDHLSLGGIETVTPVFGHLNSAFGYRNHPISGSNHFHAGVDIGGQYGDAIAAFADGVVEYIGEDDSYGLYIQLDHGNGVKSFYAHCQSLCVSQGQTVSAGETIAAVGSSGSATGPHLHLELKWNGKYLNPVYYIQVQEA